MLVAALLARHGAMGHTVVPSAGEAGGGGRGASHGGALDVLGVLETHGEEVGPTVRRAIERASRCVREMEREMAARMRASMAKEGVNAAGDAWSPVMAAAGALRSAAAGVPLGLPPRVHGTAASDTVGSGTGTNQSTVANGDKEQNEEDPVGVSLRTRGACPGDGPAWDRALGEDGVIEMRAGSKGALQGGARNNGTCGR